MAAIKSGLNKKITRITVVTGLVVTGCSLALYSHLGLKTGLLVCHMFYIPSFLAAFWWQRKGLIVAVFSGAFLIGIDVFFGLESLFLYDLIRAAAIIIISALLAELSWRMAKSHARVEYLNLMLLGIRNVNQLLISAKDRESMMQDICDILVESRGYHNVWACLTDESGITTTYHTTELKNDFSPMLELLQCGEYPVCTRKALAQPAVLITDDPALTCLNCPLSDKYRGRAGISARLEHGGEIYGVLSVSLPRKMARGREEQDLFKELSDDIALALHTFQLEEKRKSAENNLLDMEAKYQSLAESMIEPILLVDAEGTVLLANDPAVGLLGGSRNRIVGENLRDLRDEEPAKPWLDAVNEVVKSKEPTIYVDWRNKRYLESVFSPVIDAPGEVKAVTIVSHDLTDRKEDLRKEKDFNQAIIDTAQTILLVLDNEGRIVSFNPYMEKLSGYNLDEVRGRDWFDTFLPAGESVKIRAIFLQAVNDIQTTGKISSIVTKDGRIRAIEWYDKTLKDDGGNAFGLLSIGQDITERKQAEEDIRNLARFPEENPEAVVRVTKDGVLRYANPSSRTLLQLLGVRIGLALPDAWLELIRKATAVGTHETADLVCGERTFSVTAGYVPGRDYINLYANDITDRLRLQEEFRQSQKLEAVGHLAGGVAHDFNNLLTGIISCTEFVIENLEPGSPALKDLDDVLGLGYRAANLTRQLLAFSRSQPLEPIVLRPNDLIENYIEMLGRIIGEDIAIELDLDPDLGNVLADPGQLEQVILNLAVNARDAMPGGGALHIQTENVVLDDEFIQRNQIAAPGPYILISIRDTGCGMEPATLSKMFDPFFTTKKQTKGTGLGMSTVYGIVAQHNGRIRAESTPGEGTEFFIYLPRVNEEPTRPEPQASTIGGGTETILVAEDDTIVRKITERYLGQLGYTVLSAPDGPEAIETANEHKGKIDLLLTDVVMPEMGGRELFDKMSAEREELKVLYMSGYTDNAIVHHGVLDKGVIFLNKPFQKNALAVKVRRALNNAPVTQQHDPAQKPESPATILIIDDEELVREILTRVLRRLGHNVLPASGGEEALSIYGEKKDEIDLVIVDINMPKMSGIEVAERLRSINPKVTVIGSSGEADQDLNDTEVKKIFDGYISKPYGISMLSAAVSRFLDARPGDSHR